MGARPDHHRHVQEAAGLSQAGFPDHGLRRRALQGGHGRWLYRPPRAGPGQHAGAGCARLLRGHCGRHRRGQRGRRRARRDPGRELAGEGPDRLEVERQRPPGQGRPRLLQQRPGRLREIWRLRLRRQRQAGDLALAEQRLPELFAAGVCLQPDEYRADRRRLDQHPRWPGRRATSRMATPGGTGRASASRDRTRTRRPTWSIHCNAKSVRDDRARPERGPGRAHGRQGRQVARRRILPADPVRSRRAGGQARVRARPLPAPLHGRIHRLHQRAAAGLPVEPVAVLAAPSGPLQQARNSRRAHGQHGTEQRRLRSGSLRHRAGRRLHLQQRRRLHRDQGRQEPRHAVRADPERRHPALHHEQRPRRRDPGQRDVGRDPARVCAGHRVPQHALGDRFARIPRSA